MAIALDHVHPPLRVQLHRDRPPKVRLRLCGYVVWRAQVRRQIGDQIRPVPLDPLLRVGVQVLFRPPGVGGLAAELHLEDTVGVQDLHPLTLLGLGAQIVNSIHFRDFIMVQGIVMILAVGMLVWILVIDLIYAWLDPRIRYD